MTITLVRCALWLVLTTTSVAAIEPTSPASFARTLVMVQDQIVHGSTAALESVPELRQRLATAIERAPVSAWKDPQQSRALALYLLNGGAPNLIRKVLDAKVDLGHLREVVMALLAHAERRKDAAKQLEGIDGRHLDPSIAGPFALTQAIAHATDREKARAYLAQARLLSPGGLVEDSAMRREVELLITDGKRLEAARIAARYLWRFGSSHYAKDVVSFLAGSLIPELASLPDGEVAVMALTDELPVAARTETLMVVARGAMLRGSVRTADLVASRVIALALPGSAEQSRAALYKGIVSAFSDPTEAAVNQLRESDTRVLSDEDRVLLQASLLALERVRAPIDANTKGEASSSAAVQAAALAVKNAQDDLNRERP